MKRIKWLLLTAALALAFAGCGGGGSPSPSGGTFATASAEIGPSLQQALKADRPLVIGVVSDIDALAPVAVTE